MNKDLPPSLFTRFFRWYCHPRLRDHIEGDLMEVYNARLKASGKQTADRRFIIDVLLLFRPGIIRPVRYRNSTPSAMYKSYFKTGWRNISRRKLYAAINVSGLALGVCACTIIYLIIRHELSFDMFHPDSARIYRVMGDVTESTGDKLHFMKLPIPVSPSARAEVPALEAIAAIIPYAVDVSVPEEGKPAKHFESRTGETHYPTAVIAEPEYLEIFQYDWLAGNPATALTMPLSVVLSEKRAHQYFGPQSPDKIIGRQIIYDDSLTTTVSGIIKDWNKNTDLPFTDLISFASLENDFLKRSFNTASWKQGDMAAWVFTKIVPRTEPRDVQTALAAIVKKHAGAQIDLALWLEPLSQIHFNANVIENPVRTAHLPTLYGLMGIAIFILLLAVINFINLSTAQSIRRAKEVGVRKTLGSTRPDLVFQFLIETFIQTCFAVSLAVVFITPVTTAFRSFIPQGVSFDLLEPSTVVFLLFVILTTTIFAGLYPAKVLSSYLPALSLKSAGAQTCHEKWLRKGLIVFQFTVSLVFILGSIVISDQLRYTREKDLGFAADAIVTIDTPWDDDADKTNRLAERIQQLPGVENVALQWVPPMTLNGRGRAIKFSSTDEKSIGVVQVAGNEEFIPVYQIRLLAGRNLVHADSLREFVINEQLCRLMGCKRPEDAIGKMLYWDDKPYPVVGVVADFHSRSFREAIAPVCIVSRPDREKTLAIKLASKGQSSGSINTTLVTMEKKWKEVYPAIPFNYTFYDDALALLYEKDERTATLINTSMIVAIFMSCIGLFGLTLFMAETRSKEISIRKIMGASVTNIVVMLGKDFVWLVIIALFIASPIAWYFVDRWLEEFAYHVTMGWSVFALAGISSMLITLATVSYQSINAALVNPARNLASE